MDPSAAASTVEVIRAMEAKLKRATEGKQPGTGNRKSKWLGRVLEVFTAGSLQRRIPKQLTEMISNESSFAAVVCFRNRLSLYNGHGVCQRARQACAGDKPPKRRR